MGEIFSDETNAGRKKSFDIRRVMMAVVDQDHAPLERWAGMRDAETAVVWDAHLGGYPVCLIGIESQPVPRLGFVPADGPDQWTAGTLFPLSSKKVARAINAASNNRPVVVLANLSGFDGSPESMRKLQLEYGAEIGRAVVNFKGPMVFCVISRYHGGAYVVFSRALNENLEVVALEGSYASVIGGAPAAAVVFAREVDSQDPQRRAPGRVEPEDGQGGRRREGPPARSVERTLQASSTPRNWARWRRSLTACTASSARSGWARSSISFPPQAFAPTLFMRSNAASERRRIDISKDRGRKRRRKKLTAENALMASPVGQA